MAQEKSCMLLKASRQVGRLGIGYVWARCLDMRVLGGSRTFLLGVTASFFGLVLVGKFIASWSNCFIT